MSESAIKVGGTDFLTVFVRDYEAAKGFYGGVLGLEHSGDYGKAAAGEFETGNLTLQIADPTSIGREFSARATPLALRVEDVTAARAALEAKGIRFDGETIDTGVCHMAFFKDPDGNALMLHRRYAPPSD